MTGHQPSITIVRRIKAPPAKVWAAITKPELMIQWWGIDSGPTLSAEADVRPGGRFSIVFRMSDGNTFNPTGVYREVVPDRKLVLTWEGPGVDERPSLVTFQLRTIDEGTELTLVHEGLPADLVASHEKGWEALLGKLGFFLGDA